MDINCETMAYNIKLDIFEGPLDLLLHLIRENELDIYDIPIAEITKQYLEYVEIMKNLNLEMAGEFLLMAATLTHIKSKSLLPKEEFADEDDELDGADPRDELVQKLLEYKRYKEAALKLKEKELTQSQVFTRIPAESDVPSDGDLLLEVSVFELLQSFKNILTRIGEKASTYTVTLEEISVTDRIHTIIGNLEERDHITFDALFEGAKTRMELIATFLALLELTRLKLVRAHQSRVAGEILIYRTAEPSGDIISSEFDPADGNGNENGEEKGGA